MRITSADVVTRSLLRDTDVRCILIERRFHIEGIPIQKINEAYERMLKNDVKYRFVIDMASLKS